ncbi:DNA replication protein DnaC [Natranaerovirga pectinivora]|uniref:DNA replication protein DnaC n=1 Tax=Natranaerovirga pectinivora TaxID=682400 RepID=A0A4R3MM59_9FIRM|nr:ATP-binding protein [Natranaerovirga pectinivora]TCT13066.1 DNA replication protein DnaC [Natranaerovirga pectinivora]
MVNLKTSQFKQIMRLYEEKQLANQYKYDYRKKEIYNEIPEIKEIDHEISRTSIHLSKLLISNSFDSSNELKKLKEKNLELSMKKIELLHLHGYPKDYLQKQFDCNKCSDTGFIKNEKCYCFKQRLVDLAYEQSNIKSLLEHENFDSFDFTFFSTEINEKYGMSPRQNITNVYSFCIRFIKHFKTDFSNIIFYGNAGVGKSFLSNCIAKSLLDKGHNVIYLTAFQLFETFEKNKFNKNNSDIYEDLVADILNCDLLIIDDLGTEFSTSFTSSQLFNCLNTRLISKKSTIISTNLQPADWSKQYSNRIVSRIFGSYETLKIFGDDIRIKKAFKD